MDGDCEEEKVCKNNGCYGSEDCGSPISGGGDREVCFHRYLLIQDLSLFLLPDGPIPGLTLDAIALEKSNGVFFAQSIEYTYIDCDDNLACEPASVLGEPDSVGPDSVCFGGGEPDPELVTALNGGEILIDFSSEANGNVEIENGDIIRVYAVSETDCGRFEDHPFRLWVSFANSLDGPFFEIGEGGRGESPNSFTVSGLE